MKITQVMTSLIALAVSFVTVDAFAGEPYVFQIPGSWSDPDKWGNGEIPPAEAEVRIDAQCVIDSAELPIPSSISVSDNARLTINADIAVPPVTLGPFGCLKIGDGTTVVSATMATAPTGEADSFGNIPCFEIATNAVLSVPTGTKYKNIDLKVFGTLASENNAVLHFGYAEAGETASFGMTVDGGRIIVLPEPVTGSLMYHFADPAPGGRVVVPAEIVFRNARLASNNTGGATRYYFGTSQAALGKGNPEDQPVSILFDNTEMYITGAANPAQRDRVWIGGGVVVKLVNGASMLCHRVKLNNHGYQGNFPSIVDRGQLVVGPGGSLLFGDAQQVDKGLLLNPSEQDFPSVIISNGTYQVFRTSKSFRRGGIIAAGESVMTTFSTAWYGAQASPLSGASYLEIDNCSTVRVSAASGDYGGAMGQAVLMDAGARIVGTGSLMLTDKANLWMYCTNNTCSGSLAVEPTVSLRTISMYDGANWAGTVEGYNVVLASKGGGFATNSFGGLHLGSNANFSLRLGADKACDRIDLGSIGFTGDGPLSLVCEEGVDFNQRFVIASVLKSAARLPSKVGICRPDGVFVKSVVPCLSEDGHDINRYLVSIARSGMLIIVR